MLIFPDRVFALVVWARKGIVLVGAVLAAVYVVLDVPRGGEVGRTLAPVTLGLLVGGLLAAWWASTRPRPATLVCRPRIRAFDVPHSPVPVLDVTGYIRRPAGLPAAVLR